MTAGPSVSAPETLKRQQKGTLASRMCRYDQKPRSIHVLTLFAALRAPALLLLSRRRKRRDPECGLEHLERLPLLLIDPARRARPKTYLIPSLLEGGCSRQFMPDSRGYIVSRADHLDEADEGVILAVKNHPTQAAKLVL